jgi:TetR/AcrR family transcriptional regulator
MKKTANSPAPRRAHPNHAQPPEAELSADLLHRDPSRLPPEWQPPDPHSPRGRILAAARALFAEHGLIATTTRAIAESAAVNLAMIHYYYGSKEALYERVLAQEFIQVLHMVSKLIRLDDPPHEIILSIPLSISSAMRENPTWMILLRREIASGGGHMHRALRRLGGLGPLGLRRVFERAYAKGVESGRLRPLPHESLRDCLIGLAYSTIFMQPFLIQMFDRDPLGEEEWKQSRATMDTLLRHGLLLESSS